MRYLSPAFSTTRVLTRSLSSLAPKWSGGRWYVNCYRTRVRLNVSVQVLRGKVAQSIDSFNKAIYALIQCWADLASRMKSGSSLLDQFNKPFLLSITDFFKLKRSLGLIASGIRLDRGKAEAGMLGALEARLPGNGRKGRRFNKGRPRAVERG